MTLTLKGLTKEFLTDLVRLGLDDFAARGASLPAAPVGDPAWTPLAVISDGGITGFIAYVDDGDGTGHYVIMLTVDADDQEPGSRSATIDDLLQRLFDDSRRELTPLAR
jgi:hypothetical protein